MWIDKRGNWHQLYEGMPMPGAHAWSADGISWSNISGANGKYALDGCFNLTRPYKAANGSVVNVSQARYTIALKVTFHRRWYFARSGVILHGETEAVASS